MRFRITLNGWITAFGFSLFSHASGSAAQAEQDSRDAEVFGGEGEAEPAQAEPDQGPAKESPAPEKADDAAPTTRSARPIAREFIDHLEVGGRLEMRYSGSAREGEKLAEGRVSLLRQADLFFDSKPRDDLRAFFLMRFSVFPRPEFVESAELEGNGDRIELPETCDDCVRQQIDQLWVKTDVQDRLFLTIGRQHLRWGSGRIWNPTDFMASAVRDPFALFDRRLGEDLIKLHFPLETQGYNFYALAKFIDGGRHDDAALALRAEFAVFGFSELALTYQIQRQKAMNLGLDVSSALGPVDVYAEGAFSQRQERRFYSGRIDPETGEIPVEKDKSNKRFVQAVAGVRKSWDYSESDTVSVGIEGFLNELGYRDRILGLYSLVRGDSQPLYVGQRYAAFYVSLPEPGSWNDHALYLNGIRNFDDKTAVLRLTASWEMFSEAMFEAFYGRCFGDYGELCFRIPERFTNLASAPELDETTRRLVAVLPTKRAIHSFGAGLSVTF